MNFYLCLICGNVIELIDGVANRIACCNQEMELLVPNTVDAALEKHVPFCEIVDGKVNVQIGEVVHPMVEDHYILFIAIVKGSKISRVDLKPGMEPKATFTYEEGSTIFAYCNKHGLWKKDI
ncbi:MAG: desulfoferrodoxin family protein [Bacilli bacterium]|nr:desulfoferrodoxin family protein [Bacilli bacterium]